MSSASPKIALEGLVHEDQTLGLGLYAQMLIEGLSQVENEFQWVLHDFLWRDFYNRESKLWCPPPFQTKLHKFPRPLMQLFEERLNIKIQNRWLKDSGVQLYHGLRGILPPLEASIKSVVTVHSVAHAINPHWYQDIWYRRFKKSVQEADRVVAVSHNTAEDLSTHYDLPAEKITTIHQGIDPNFRVIGNPEQLSDTQKRFNLYTPFVLFVGGLRPIKNLPRLLEAFAQFSEAGHRDWQLVLTGRPVHGTHPIDQSIERLGLKNQVVFTDFVERQTLVDLYNLATIFAFPTLYEGFGYPVLEAMACDTPVLAANTSSLPEVCGEAALLVDPTDTQAIAQGLGRLADDASLRQDLKRKGQDQIKKFSWPRSVRQYLEVYRKILEIESK